MENTGLKQKKMSQETFHTFCGSLPNVAELFTFSLCMRQNIYFCEAVYPVQQHIFAANENDIWLSSFGFQSYLDVEPETTHSRINCEDYSCRSNYSRQIGVTVIKIQNLAQIRRPNHTTCCTIARQRFIILCRA